MKFLSIHFISFATLHPPCDYIYDDDDDDDADVGIYETVWECVA